jgi:hypothetical protein
MESKQLYQLIVAQLEHDGFPHAAQAVAGATLCAGAQGGGTCIF